MHFLVEDVEGYVCKNTDNQVLELVKNVPTDIGFRTLMFGASKKSILILMVLNKKKLTYDFLYLKIGE